MRKVRFALEFIDKINDALGVSIGALVLPMTLILGWEVIMRYGFDLPTIWAHEMSQNLYAVHFLFGGVYCLRWGAHVNITILHERFPARARAIVDLVTWLFFYLFIGALFCKGLEKTWASVAILEHSSSAWNPPIWPVYLAVPLACILMLLQGLRKTISDIYLAITGRQFITMNPEMEIPIE